MMLIFDAPNTDISAYYFNMNGHEIEYMDQRNISQIIKQNCEFSHESVSQSRCFG